MIAKNKPTTAPPTRNIDASTTGAIQQDSPSSPARCVANNHHWGSSDLVNGKATQASQVAQQHIQVHAIVVSPRKVMLSIASSTIIIPLIIPPSEQGLKYFIEEGHINYANNWCAQRGR